MDRNTYGAVAECDSACELDEVTSTDRVVLLHERNEVVHTVGDTVVGREERLNSWEKEHRAVGSSTAAGKIGKTRFIFVGREKIAYAEGPILREIEMASSEVCRPSKYECQYIPEGPLTESQTDDLVG